MNYSCQNNENRVIRVFISSTFSDMQAERDELIKFVFPQLRSLCESRGVVWGEVDLRWGITEEEKAEGKVLPLCLEEIKNCRPYFIGLLGERYGWVPDGFPPELVESEPWLMEHLNYSVTELEILHGVLRNPNMAEHAFFYLRNPSYIQALPEEQRSIYEERIVLDEIAHFGQAEGEERLEKRKRKLQLLKDKIRESGFPFRENYLDPKELGELVLRDMTRVIDTLFPEGSAPDLFVQQSADHWQYANARSAVYMGKKEYFDRLDCHVNGDGQPLAILGESGAGKSALLSAWALRYQETHPDVLVIPHFIGATQYSSDCIAMLRRIMGELRRYFNIQEDIPDKHEDVVSSLLDWLRIAASRGRVVIILDAVNQLENNHSARDLVWIPEYVPTEISIVVSTLPGQALDEIMRRKWETLTIQPLTSEERKEFVFSYLNQYSKKLSINLTDILVAAPQTASPLYLKTLLEELRIYGDHETLLKQLKYYLSSNSIVDLYEKILDRYEQDYDRERPNLVKDSMTLIWAARNGLSENELLDILGYDDLPLPHFIWSPLSLVSKDVLIRLSGLISINHTYFNQAIIRKYLYTDDNQAQAHLKLAEYFKKKKLSQRVVDELPYQLKLSYQLDALHDFVVNIINFNYIFNLDNFKLMQIWSDLSYKYDADKSYLKYISLLDQSSSDSMHLMMSVNNIGVFLYNLNFIPAAKEIFEKIISTYNNKSINDNTFISSVYNNLGAVYEAINDKLNARKYYNEAIESSLSDGQASYGTYYNNLAHICYILGEHNEAEKYYLKAIDIFEIQYGPNSKYIASCLSSIASLLVTQYISNAIATRDIVSIVITNTELLSRAESIAKDALHMKEMYYGRYHLEIVSALNVLADILIKEDKCKDAEELLYRSLKISKSLRGTINESIISTIDILIDMYLLTSDYKSAISACREALRLKELHFGATDLRTISAVKKLHSSEKLVERFIGYDITNKYLEPLVTYRYIPIPFPFVKYLISIIATYYTIKFFHKSSSVILSIFIVSIILGAYNKTTNKGEDSENEPDRY